MYKYKKTNSEEREVTIIFLANAFYFNIDWAMIFFEQGEYRLVVHYQDELTTDKRYKFPGDAIKNFKEIYKRLKFMDTYNPMWKGPYEVEPSFVNNKLKYARKRKIPKKIFKYFRFKKEYLLMKFGWECKRRKYT